MADLKVELRRAAEADLHDLIELELTLMPDRTDAAVEAARRQCDRLDRQAQGSVWFIVAEHRGGIVGQLVLRLPGQPDRWGRDDRRDFADIEDIRVLPSYQRQGVATEMLGQIEWECMQEGISRIGLTTDRLEGGRVAAWFGQMGYEPAGPPYAVGGEPFADADGETGQVVCVDMIKEI